MRILFFCSLAIRYFILWGACSDLLSSFSCVRSIFLCWYQRCLDTLNTSPLLSICIKNISTMLFKLCSSRKDQAAFGGRIYTAQLYRVSVRKKMIQMAMPNLCNPTWSSRRLMWDWCLKIFEIHSLNLFYKRGNRIGEIELKE